MVAVYIRVVGQKLALLQNGDGIFIGADHLGIGIGRGVDLYINGGRGLGKAAIAVRDAVGEGINPNPACGGSRVAEIAQAIQTHRAELRRPESDYLQDVAIHIHIIAQKG